MKQSVFLAVALGPVGGIGSAGPAEIGERLFVHREESHRGTILRGHIADGGPVCEPEPRQARSEELDEFIDHPVLAKELGRRHKGYGVKTEHYGTVATALLWTLEKGLGDAFTPTAKEAWTQTYTVLAKTMQAASSEEGVPAMA